MRYKTSFKVRGQNCPTFEQIHTYGTRSILPGRTNNNRQRCLWCSDWLCTSAETTRRHGTTKLILVVIVERCTTMIWYNAKKVHGYRVVRTSSPSPPYTKSLYTLNRSWIKYVKSHLFWQHRPPWMVETKPIWICIWGFTPGSCEIPNRRCFLTPTNSEHWNISTERGPFTISHRCSRHERPHRALH